MAADDGLDLRDVLLEVEADVTEILDEIQKELLLPMMRSEFTKQWLELPDDMKEKFKTEQPEKYKALMKLIE